eukprot:GHVQ01025663.1.p1 GENE.GHVQ01025663.1~~GHVQ01025663.1.p1  ORF type:complete len:402 (-),score=36.25 GHVQ01025663.1:48-1253(-)
MQILCVKGMRIVSQHHDNVLNMVYSKDEINKTSQLSIEDSAFIEDKTGLFPGSSLSSPLSVDLPILSIGFEQAWHAHMSANKQSPAGFRYVRKTPGAGTNSGPYIASAGVIPIASPSNTAGGIASRSRKYPSAAGSSPCLQNPESTTACLSGPSSPLKAKNPRRQTPEPLGGTSSPAWDVTLPPMEQVCIMGKIHDSTLSSSNLSVPLHSAELLRCVKDDSLKRIVYEQLVSSTRPSTASKEFDNARTFITRYYDDAPSDRKLKPRQRNSLYEKFIESAMIILQQVNLELYNLIDDYCNKLNQPGKLPQLPQTPTTTVCHESSCHELSRVSVTSLSRVCHAHFDSLYIHAMSHVVLWINNRPRMSYGLEATCTAAQLAKRARHGRPNLRPAIFGSVGANVL